MLVKQCKNPPQTNKIIFRSAIYLQPRLQRVCALQAKSIQTIFYYCAISFKQVDNYSRITS